MQPISVHPLQRIDFVTPPATTFRHLDFGPMGVGAGGQVIIGLDSHFDTSRFDELHDEVCVGLAKCRELGFGKVIGPLPPRLRGKYAGLTFPEDMLANLEAYDRDGRHRRNLQAFDDWESRWRYMCFAMGAVVPWFFTVYLRQAPFTEKTSHAPSRPEWLANARHFPRLRRFIESELPFESIGRVLFFTTFPNCGVPTHRDFNIAPHRDHNINFFFDRWRPSFVYDEVRDHKIFLKEGQRSYFFNNRDYHGVDPEPLFRYTLRVDGTFNKALQQSLGLEDGYVFRWEYEHAKRALARFHSRVEAVATQ